MPSVPVVAWLTAAELVFTPTLGMDLLLSGAGSQGRCKLERPAGKGNQWNGVAKSSLDQKRKEARIPKG